MILPSSTTIEWTKSHNYRSFSTAKMEDTRLADLKVKVGFPYLYCHQGDCEHLVIITDVRSVLRSVCPPLYRGKLGDAKFWKPGITFHKYTRLKLTPSHISSALFCSLFRFINGTKRNDSVLKPQMKFNQLSR